MAGYNTFFKLLLIEKASSVMKFLILEKKKTPNKVGFK